VRPKERANDTIRTLGQVRVSRGEVVGLDEDRFTVEKGREGLFTPVQSALLNGYGIFFLEPYDPKKVPVLFVHGLGDARRISGSSSSTWTAQGSSPGSISIRPDCDLIYPVMRCSKV